MLIMLHLLSGDRESARAQLASSFLCIQAPSPGTELLNQVPCWRLGWDGSFHSTQSTDVSLASLDVVKLTLPTLTPVSVSLRKLSRGSFAGKKGKSDLILFQKMQEYVIFSAPCLLDSQIHVQRIGELRMEPGMQESFLPWFPLGPSLFSVLEQLQLDAKHINREAGGSLVDQMEHLAQLAVAFPCTWPRHSVLDDVFRVVFVCFVFFILVIEFYRF